MPLHKKNQTKRRKPCGCGKKRQPAGDARPAIPPTRPSCLECVEKHLGAAWVLLAEYRDGYPFRLRAIGHLHEAEDESQEWPDLHDTIRDARRTFQQANVMPDWGALAEAANTVRKATH